MKRKTLLVATFVVVLGFISAINVQAAPNRLDGTPEATAAATVLAGPNCAPAALIKTLASIKSAKDPVKDLATLLTLRNAINDQDVACTTGLVWKGHNNKSIGPFTLPAGSYLFHLVTTDYFIGHLTPISDSCELTAGTLFNIGAGDATDGEDTTLTMGDCKMLITVENVSVPYTLTITLLN